MPGEETVRIFSLDMGNLVQVAILIAAAWLLIHVLGRVLPWIADRLPAARRLDVLATVPVVRLFIIVAAIALVVPRVIYPTFENLVAIMGAAGLAIGFAFRDYVSSLIAGVVALYERPYRPGDWVEIGSVYGEVKSMGLRALSVVTPDDTVVVIPHMKMWTDMIHNANNGARELMCVADFYLHPEHDAARVRQKLVDVALTSPFLQLDKAITVVAIEKPWGTHYRLKGYPMDGRDQFQFVTDLTVRGKEALSRIGARPAATFPATTA